MNKHKMEMIVITGAVLLSAKSIFIKILFEEGLSVMQIMLYRSVMVLPIYLFLLLLALRKHRESISFQNICLVSGMGLLCYYAASLLDVSSLQYISSSTERLVMYLYPILVVVINCFRKKKPPNRHLLLALFLAYAGLPFLFFDELGGSQIIKGFLFVFSAALLSALYMVMAKGVMLKVRTALFTPIAMMATSVAVCIHIAALEPSSFVLTNDSHVVYMYLGVLVVFCTILPLYLINFGIQKLGGEKVSLLAMVGPVATLGLGVVFLNESFGMAKVLGTVLILIGMYFVNSYKAS